MPYERESFVPINAQEVLLKNDVRVGDVFVYTVGSEVRALVKQQTDGLEPLYSPGVAVRQNGESDEELTLKAVGNAVNAKDADFTMFLRQDQDQSTGNTILRALSPKNEVFVSVAPTPAQAAGELMTALSYDR
jgi:hypothetical protein